MKTKLILRQDLPELGHTGDVIEVSSGYARNYLLPNDLAYAYSEDAMRRIEKARAEAEQVRAELRADMEALAKRLEWNVSDDSEDVCAIYETKKGKVKAKFNSEGKCTVTWLDPKSGDEGKYTFIAKK